MTDDKSALQMKQESRKKKGKRQKQAICKVAQNLQTIKQDKIDTQVNCCCQLKKARKQNKRINKKQGQIKYMMGIRWWHYSRCQYQSICFYLIIQKEQSKQQYFITLTFTTTQQFMLAASSDNAQYNTPDQAVQDNISAVQQMILDRVMLLSFEHNDKFVKKQRGLPEKYRKLIVNMKMTKSSQKCSICLSEFCQGQLIKKLPCRHIYHRQCAKEWLKTSKNCPNCRFDLEEHFEKLEKEGKIAVIQKKQEGNKGKKCQEKCQRKKQENELIYKSQSGN